MPLSMRIKSLMLIESIASFLTVGLVATGRGQHPQHVAPAGARTSG
jgi:hypothetical protein